MVSSNQKPKFVADQMLGKLAKWLRILGFDTEYFNDIDDAQLLRIAHDEQRILLTRDTQLLKTRPVVRNQISAILITNDRYEHQLEELMSGLGLQAIKSNQTICPNCNILIKKIPRQETRGMVPSYVYKTHSDFSFCPQCHSFFWQGTHWKNIRSKIDQLRDSR